MAHPVSYAQIYGIHYSHHIAGNAYITAWVHNTYRLSGETCGYIRSLIRSNYKTLFNLMCLTLIVIIVIISNSDIQPNTVLLS